MSFTQITLGFIKHVQPPVLPVSKVKTEAPMEIKNEPPESDIVEIGVDNITSSLEEETIPDLKDIDIVLHPLCEGSIKSETVPEDPLKTKHLESVETQVYVKTENSPFLKRKKTEDTSDGNGSWGTGQGMVEVQGHHKVTAAPVTCPKGSSSNGICYKTDRNTSWKKGIKKIKVIKVPVIPVEAHEYTSLAEGQYVCNHCQHACNKLTNLKCHIRKMHREVTTMYQCPYCPYKSKWSLRYHIILKHKDTKDIQWFQCNLCEMKFKLKCNLTQHNMNIHLKHKQMQDGLDLREKSYHCNNCGYKTEKHINLKKHKLVHLKPEEIQYFYCYHCSYKCKRKDHLKSHIFKHYFKNVKQGKRHHCDKCDYKTYITADLTRHKLVHLKPQEIEYFYCYHCFYKTKRKKELKIHIFRHFKKVELKREKRHHCDRCDYKCYTSTMLKAHKIKHLKPEDISYFHCYHCSYKAKQKGNLQRHIFIHLKNGEVKFDCYICNFMTQKRESIVEHIKKHSK